MRCVYPRVGEREFWMACSGGQLCRGWVEFMVEYGYYSRLLDVGDSVLYVYYGRYVCR